MNHSALCGLNVSINQDKCSGKSEHRFSVLFATRVNCNLSFEEAEEREGAKGIKVLWGFVAAWSQSSESQIGAQTLITSKRKEPFSEQKLCEI